MADFASLLADLRAEHAALDARVEGLDDAQWHTATPAEGWDILDSVSHLAYFDETSDLALTDADAFAEHARRLPAASPARSRPWTFLRSTQAQPAARAHQTVPFNRGRQPNGRRRPTGGRGGPQQGQPTGGYDCEGGATGHPGRCSRTVPRSRRAAAPLAPVTPGTPHPPGRRRRGRPAGPGPLVRAVHGRGELRHRPPHGDLGPRSGRGGRPWAGACRLDPATPHLPYRRRRAAYAFMIHGVPDPGTPVRVEARYGEGEVWTWGPDDAPDRLRGPALDLALVFTQRRHPADTLVVAEGPTARAWLAVAQSFAGPAGKGRPPLTHSASAPGDPT